MSNEFKKLINTAKEINLSPEKKDFIRARVQEFISMTPVKQPITSPLRSPFYLTKFSVMHFSKAVSLALIVLIAGGGTMSYASEDTLPGDTFYTVKVNFKEPIEEKLAFGPEAKLQVKTKQVEKRLNEAQVLLKKNDMSPEKHKEVEERVEAKVQEIGEAIDKLQEKGDVETILATTGKLEPVLKAHQEALLEVTHEEALIAVEEVALMKTNLVLDDSISTNEINPMDTKIMAEEVTLEAGSKAHVTGTLLETLERTLVQVEEKETKALETVANLENTDLNNERITNATDKKVLEATKEINEIKNDLALETMSSTQIVGEQTPEATIASIDEALKNDAIILSITEAEILLAEAKRLFEQGMYKEALEKAQAAIKLTATIEATKNIEAAQDATIEIEEVEQVTTPVESIPEILVPEKNLEPELIPSKETTPKTLEETLKIEDQASQAIEALENKLKPESLL